MPWLCHRALRAPSRPLRGLKTTHVAVSSPVGASRRVARGYHPRAGLGIDLRRSIRTAILGALPSRIRRGSAAPYHSLHYHLVWRTQGSQPIIVGLKRNRLLELIAQKTYWLGCHLHAVNAVVNAVADHVHLLVGIPPKLSVAQVVGQIKASASTRINREFPEEVFRWQAEYAAFTVSVQALPQHVAYVQRQVEHHEQGDVITAYEPA